VIGADILAAFVVGSLTWFPSLEFAQAFAFLYLAWLILEVFNSIRGRSRRGHSQDRGSYGVIYLGIFLSLTLAFVMRGLNLGVAAGWAQFLGLAIVPVGMTFRERSIVILGRSFSVRVQIKEGQRLTTRGPYRWIRHPAYGGALLTIVGVPLALGTWAGALVTAMIGVMVYSYRVRVEEQALVTTFGDEYREYRRHTWKFLPGL
jgi:protein-S-isoprenylcysteine O-methyltransferase Ste14